MWVACDCWVNSDIPPLACDRRLTGTDASSNTGLDDDDDVDTRQAAIDDIFDEMDDDDLMAVDLDALDLAALAQNASDPEAVRRALREALAAAMQKHGLGSVEEEEGIKLSHHQKDVFHALQQLSIGFGCSNSWAPLLLKCVANCLLVDDPETKESVLKYLQSEHEKQPGVNAASARLEATKQYHSFIRKNSRYMKKAPMTPEETYAKLKLVERVFAGAVCTKKKGPPRMLFNTKARKAWMELLKMVLDGHHGAVAGVARYLRLGKCENTELDEFSCVANTSWLESWHNAQRNSATHGLGMMYADLMLHLCVDRWNVDAGIKYAGSPNFGFKGIHLYDTDVIEEIVQVRQGAPKGTFAPDVCDKFTSPTGDTMERFGIARAMKDYYSVMDRGNVVETYNKLEKHFEFTQTKIGETVTKLDLEVLATLVQGTQLCEEQEEVLSRSIGSLAELQRDAVSVTDLAQLVCTVIKAQPQAAATAATGATATARKYTRDMPLRVIDSSSLTDSSACDNSRRRQHRHRS